MIAYRIEEPEYWDITPEEDAVALTKEEMHQRFTVQEIREFYNDGYRLYEYRLQNTHETRGEYVITKDNIIHRIEIPYKEIWSDY